jgi:hypothetical protein
MCDTVAFTARAPARRSKPAVRVAVGVALADTAGGTTWWARDAVLRCAAPQRATSQAAEHADLHLGAPQREAASTENTCPPGAAK